jgi:hypothetical protein
VVLRILVRAQLGPYFRTLFILLSKMLFSLEFLPKHYMFVMCNLENGEIKDACL